MSDLSVTCLCPTTLARAAWLPRALACFQAQSYQNCGLLVGSEDGEVEALLPRADSRIRFVLLPRGVTLGKKRNLLCDLAPGPILAHFDDDDWSASGRLEDQVSRLEATGFAVTGYTLMKFTDGERWWRYAANPSWPLGTSLCFRAEWWRDHPFPDIQVASDNTFINAAIQARQLASVPAGDMMAAGVHPGNTNAAKRKLGDPKCWPRLDAGEAIPALLAAWAQPEAVTC